ncbi:MFS transporter [bacterium]|nr:MFS transporter [bacterium]
MRLSEKKVVGFVCASHSMVHIAELYFAGLLLYMEADFGASHETMGKVQMPFAFFFGATAPLAGWLAGRLGSFNTLTLYLAGCALTLPLVAFTNTPLQLTLALALLGIFVGLYHPAGLSGISRLSHRPGRALGYHGFAGNFGLAMGPFIAVLTADALGLGWRGSYALLCLPFGVLAMLVYRLSRLEPAAHAAAAERRTTRVHFDLPALALVLLIVGGNGILYRMVLTFFTARLDGVFAPVAEAWNLGPKMLSGIIMSGFLLIGAAGQLASGYLSEHFSLGKLLAAIFLLSGISLILFGLGGVVVVILSGCAFGSFFFAAQPVANGLLSRLTPPEQHGFVYGLSSFFTFGVGSIGSYIGGVVATRHGEGTVYVAAGIATLVMAGLPLLLPTHRMSRP